MFGACAWQMRSPPDSDAHALEVRAPDRVRGRATGVKLWALAVSRRTLEVSRRTFEVSRWTLAVSRWTLEVSECRTAKKTSEMKWRWKGIGWVETERQRSSDAGVRR